MSTYTIKKNKEFIVEIWKQYYDNIYQANQTKVYINDRELY